MLHRSDEWKVYADEHVRLFPDHEVYVYFFSGWECVTCDAMDPADVDWLEITGEYPRD